MVPLFPILVGLLAAFVYKPVSNDLLRITEHGSARVLLLTAHPDDEAMFFSPTLLALKDAPIRASEVQTDASEQVFFSTEDLPTSRSKVFSLCLSTGNAEGLGSVRTAELSQSLDLLGLDADKRWVVDNPDLQDSMTANWDPATIAQVLLPYVMDNEITTILTFDSEGVSDHPNHKALPDGVRELWKVLPNHIAKPRLFALNTVTLFRKYSTFIGAAFSKFDLYGSKVLIYYDALLTKGFENIDAIPKGSSAKLAKDKRLNPVFISGYASYATGIQAMLAHKSQLVWFRWLYLAFSRYMWINEWSEVTA